LQVTPYPVDLSQIENKPINEDLFKSNTNEFTFTLPKSGNTLTFKLLTHKDEQDINCELEGLKKINKGASPELFTSVEGKRDKKDISEFVDNYLLADSRALREYIRKIQPDVYLTFFPSKSISLLGLAFFGLTSDIAPQVRAAVFTQIHQIVFHGKGRYDWHTVYNMPIWLRRFTFKQIADFYENEKSSYENKSSGGSKTEVNSDRTVNTPSSYKLPKDKNLPPNINKDSSSLYL
jgi:hypothetical protein